MTGRGPRLFLLVFPCLGYALAYMSRKAVDFPFVRRNSWGISDRAERYPILFSSEFGEDSEKAPLMKVRDEHLSAKGEMYSALMSLEVYACEPRTQALVISQLANWIRAESHCISVLGFQSIVFASLDGSRVVHGVTWKATENAKQSFEAMRKRGEDTPDCSPVALKESTHIYSSAFSLPDGAVSLFTSVDPESYPLFSLDLFNCHTPANLPAVQNTLTSTLLQMDVSMIPGYEAIHVLTAKDSLVCGLMGSWKNVNDYYEFREDEAFQKCARALKLLANEGTMSDFMAKKSSIRLYTVQDVYAPHPLTTVHAHQTPTAP